MSSRRGRFWPWGRPAGPGPEPVAPSGGGELSAAMQALRLAYSGSSPGLPALAAQRAGELCSLGFEHQQVADELQAAAELHRDSAARAGRRAAWALGAARPGMAVPAPRTGTEPRPGLPDAPAGDPGQADVVVRVLGQLEVQTPTALVTSWGGQRTRTLFQYLLMHRRPVHREVLMELLWPGHTYSSARNNLNVCVYSLRRAVSSAALGGKCIVYRDACYSLNRELAWDVDRDRFVDAAERGRQAAERESWDDAVAALQRAASVYGGPLFDGDPAADWFLPERTALQELFLQVLERLARLLLRGTDLDGAQTVLEQLLREDGCRESAHRLLMGCFAHRGQCDLVARQYQRCTARLAAELGIMPSAETTGLFHTLTRAP
jgi:DNA-binding SARP family transcriptional activator